MQRANALQSVPEEQVLLSQQDAEPTHILDEDEQEAIIKELEDGARTHERTFTTAFTMTAVILSVVLVWGLFREAPPMDLGGANPTAQLNHSWVLLTTCLAVVALLMQGGGLQRRSLATAAFGATLVSTACALVVWGRGVVSVFPGG